MAKHECKTVAQCCEHIPRGLGTTEHTARSDRGPDRPSTRLPASGPSLDGSRNPYREV